MLRRFKRDAAERKLRFTYKTFILFKYVDFQNKIRDMLEIVLSGKSILFLSSNKVTCNNLQFKNYLLIFLNLQY